MSPAPVGYEAVLDDVLPPFPTDDERALASALRELERADELLAPDGWEPDPDSLLDADVVAALDGPASPADLLLLDSLDLAPGDRPAQLGRLRAVDRVEGLLASMRVAAVVALAGERSSGGYLEEVAVENAVAVARGTSRYAAGLVIETARALTTTFTSFLSALRAGEVSESHCRVLVDRTRAVVDPEALAAVERAVLPHARREPVGRFADAVENAVARYDVDAAARFRRVREQRRVTTQKLADGMGFLGLVHSWPTISAIGELVAADARRLQAARRASADIEPGAAAAAIDADDSPEGLLRADQARADALAGRILGRVAPDGSVDWDPAQVEVHVQLVVDLDTLRGEAEHPCLLDGQPVPAEIGRDLAGYARAWRRMVTDPVTGHLLDYGRETYLPGPLRTYDLARDGKCRAPDCSVRSVSRLQCDHVEPFPAGASSTGNTGALCPTCHQLKTAGLVRLTDSASDGSCTWHTVFGQAVHVPPRAYLVDPDPPPTGTRVPAALSSPPAGDPDSDPPPF